MKQSTNNAIRLRVLNNIPSNAFIHVPDEWRQSGVSLCCGGFEYHPTYRHKDQPSDSLDVNEYDLLERGDAWFRVQIDKFTVRDFKVLVK